MSSREIARISMNKLLSTVALSVALVIPTCVGLAAQDDHKDKDQHQRYYDKHHKDYHEYDAHEAKAWQIYAQQEHQTVTFEHANDRQRQQYWDWRHNHSDAVLQIDIR